MALAPTLAIALTCSNSHGQAQYGMDITLVITLCTPSRRSTGRYGTMPLRMGSSRHHTPHTPRTSLVLDDTIDDGLVDTIDDGLVDTIDDGLVETIDNGLVETIDDGLVETPTQPRN